MPTTLTNGIQLPDKGSVDWYSSMQSNYNLIDTHLGNTDIHVTAEDKANWDSKQGSLSQDQIDAIAQVATNTNDIATLQSGKADASHTHSSSDITDIGDYATKQYVDNSISGLVDNAPDALNTLNELSAALNDDSNFASTVTTALSNKANSADLATVATSGYYDDLTDLPTYGITRYCSSAITDNSSVAFSAISSTNKIKVGDFLLDTAGKMYQISSVDTANETVYVTTPLTQLAVDSSVMHLSGNETADGLKTFLKYITSDGSSTGDEYSSNTRTNLWLMGNRDTEEVSGVLFDTYRQNTAQGTGTHILGLSIKENSVRYEGCRWGWYWNNDLNGYTFDFKPTTQGANQAVNHNLGTSTAKWDTINGINPGALSLPDLNNGIDISGYITNFGAGTVNEYTPVSDGWISIASSGDSPIFIRMYNDYGFEQVTYSERNEVGGTTGGTYTRFGSLMIPCVKNVKIYIIVSPSTSVLVSAKFYPCQGNV